MNNNETRQAQVRQQTAHDEISRRAEELWRQYSSPQGRDEEIWLEAERQVRGFPTHLGSPVSESVGADQAGAVNPASASPDIGKSRETEMMESQKSAPPKANSRGKGKQSRK